MHDESSLMIHQAMARSLPSMPHLPGHFKLAILFISYRSGVSRIKIKC